MKQVNLILSTDVSAEKVWALLADFSGFLNWAGGGAGEISIEGEGIGMVRHLKMSGGELAERLTLLDPDNKRLGYDLVYGEPLGMKKYKAIVQVVDTGSGCDIIWKGVFDTEDPGSQDQTGAALSAAYEGMTGALVAYLTR
ncbi:MAG: SRPBCC family protein [Gammaproteobacteria bacterium]|nr:SRPBCC family protein [Gammaproteobacteria bacterium]MBT5154278.1 SRPBCC family protein [Gammaproteobacteria bacterium]MBT6585528.1 SRPBCC family protein [Gammaproteobacteria bacterium]MBT6891911.1 SRPBCC family protein [Gammaproteobacteria bacterium]